MIREQSGQRLLQHWHFWAPSYKEQELFLGPFLLVMVGISSVRSIKLPCRLEFWIPWPL